MEAPKILKMQICKMPKIGLDYLSQMRYEM